MKFKMNTWQASLCKITFCCTALMSLSACVEMMVGGAVVGTFAATDRRTFGAQTEDKAIILKGEVKMNRLFGSAAHINVTSFNRRALLTGEVADEATKQKAEQEMRAIDGVLSVANELQVGWLSSLATRSNDTLITTKVMASLVDAKDISANVFKVVTESGNVYLMGRVTQAEGNKAADIARGVSGVRQVVKIFEYISEEQWKEYQSKPSK